ncbi:MAG: glycosyltransferase family 2 protein [Oscillochloris sp.]|nr:glycosyltransferase family 2 protein [Oscillochloris sp.]
MTPLVTVAVPVYKRLNYVGGAVRSVAAQDYPNIELIVSDNGQNGETLAAIVREHYPKPFVFRRNPQTVTIVEHFNQLVAAASGTYFVLLSDDDYISPEYVSSLVARLEADSQIAVAIGRVETFSEDDERVLQTTDGKALPPALMSFMELIRTWSTYKHRYLSFTTNVSRTAEIRAVGGYPDFDRANGSDDGLLIKLILGRNVAFEARGTFHHRIHNTSYGKAASIDSLALACRQYLHFLRHDPRLKALQQRDPATYNELWQRTSTMVYNTYLGRWRGLYRDQMPVLDWMRAGLALPLHPRFTRDALASIIYRLPGFSNLARHRNAKPIQ